MDLQLDEQVVLVTGGSKGIGRAIVRAFLEEGARVANVSRPGPEAESLAREARQGGRTYGLVEVVDLVEPGACRQAVAAARKPFGPIDVVVNNAGVNDGVDLRAGLDAFKNSLERNLFHCYELVHEALDDLTERRGAIVNIGSKVATTGQGGTSGYAAAKGALNALTREWAADLASCGVRVNTVIPAEVWTPLYEKWLGTLDDPPSQRKKIERLIPLGHRFTKPEEIAAMAVFLASPRSGHTTGQIVYVDGGYTHLDRKLTAIEPHA